MKRFARISVLSLLLLVVSLFLVQPASAKSDSPGIKTLKARITAVTVYADRAQVTRSAAETLPAGEYRLMFDHLPEGLEPGSIQVNGTGNAVLSDVKTNIERYVETPDQDLKALLDEKTALEDRLGQMNANIGQARNEKSFLENIAKKLTGVTEKTPAGELDPEKWVKMVDFYRNRNAALNKEIVDIEIAKREVTARLDKVCKEIADSGSNAEKTRYQVEVLVRMKEAGEVSLRLSYLVHGPSWEPVYDLRVSTREKKMNLVYSAVVRQSTGEAWDDVALELSTAQPAIGGEQPELSPWRLSFYEPRPEYREMRRNAAMAAAPVANQMMMMDSAGSLAKLEAAAEPSALEIPTARVQANATSVVFAIKGRNTIASDNLPHKVTVSIQDFPAEFRYSTAPKLAPFAYLKTKVRNTSDFPLLPGSTNVFLDSNFVANASLNQVAPGEDFWTFLGVDGAIKVERKFLRKHQEQEGVFEKKTKVVYEYLTEITNNKKSDEELVVWDQIPISSHQEIVVKLLEPQFDKESPTIKKNELNYIEWLFKLKAGEKLKIPFVYFIEYPQGRQVEGLD